MLASRMASFRRSPLETNVGAGSPICFVATLERLVIVVVVVVVVVVVDVVVVVVVDVVVVVVVEVVAVDFWLTSEMLLSWHGGDDVKIK